MKNNEKCRKNKVYRNVSDGGREISGVVAQRRRLVERDDFSKL